MFIWNAKYTHYGVSAAGHRKCVRKYRILKLNGQTAQQWKNVTAEHNTYLAFNTIVKAKNLMNNDVGKSHVNFEGYHLT